MSDPFDLSACKLLITMEATEEIALERLPGSSVRGALFEALLRRFCMNPEARTCAECALNPTCPVAGLVAPLRDEHPRGRDTPRPFVIAVETGRTREAQGGAPDAAGDGGRVERDAGTALSERRLAAGEEFTLAVTLFGRAIAYFPYVALSLPVIERVGIGRPLRAHRGQRGRPRVARIEALQPFSGERESLYRGEGEAARAPTLLITPEMVAARAAELPTDRLTVDFVTPTRLIAEGRLLRRPEMRALALRLVERLEALEQAYGSTRGAVGADEAEDDQAAHTRRRERYRAFERLAQGVRVARDETRWVEATSHSARQQRSLPIGGFVGEVTFEGELGGLRELLAWGEVAHAGKNAVKGDGCMRVKASESERHAERALLVMRRTDERMPSA